MKKAYYLIYIIAFCSLLSGCDYNFSKHEEALNQGLRYIQEIESTGSIYVNVNYFKAITEVSHYRIDSWELETISVSDSSALIKVKGSVINGFGAELNRSPIFLLEKVSPYSEWQIIDSYGFLAGDKINKVDLDISDIDKFKIVSSLSDSIKIEEWSYSIDAYGYAKGNGIVFNSSLIPVNRLKASINYKNNYQEAVNSDEIYVLTGDDLLPGQKRKFSWTTRNCGDCSEATIRLLIQD